MGYLNRLLCLLLLCLMPLTCIWKTLLFISRIKYMYMLSLTFVYWTGFLALIEFKIHTLDFKIFLTLFVISVCILVFTIANWVKKKTLHMSASYPTLLRHRTFHAFENDDPEPDAPRVLVVQLGNVISIPPSTIRMPEVPPPEPLTASEVLEEIFRKISPTASVKSSRRHSAESTKTSKHVRSHSEPFSYYRRQLSDQSAPVPTLQEKSLPETSRSEECVIRIQSTTPKENMQHFLKYDTLRAPIYNVPYETSVGMSFFGKTVSRKTSLSPKTSRYVRPKSPTEFEEVIIRKHSVGSSETPEQKVPKHRRHHSEPYKFHRRHVRSEQIKQTGFLQNEKQPEISRSVECVIEADIHPEPKEKIEPEKLNANVRPDHHEIIGKISGNKKASLTTVQSPKADLILQPKSPTGIEDQIIREHRVNTSKTSKQKVSRHKRHRSEPYKFHRRQVRSDYRPQTDTLQDEVQSLTSRSEECIIRINFYADKDGKISATVVEDCVQTSLEVYKTEDAGANLSQKQLCITPVQSPTSESIEGANNWKLLEQKEITSSTKHLEHYGISSPLKDSEQQLKIASTSKVSEQQRKLSNTSNESEEQCEITSTPREEGKQHKTAGSSEDVRKQNEIAATSHEARKQHEIMGTSEETREQDEIVSKLEEAVQQHEITDTPREQHETTSPSEIREQDEIASESEEAGQQHTIAYTSELREQDEIASKPEEAKQQYEVPSKSADAKQKHEITDTSREQHKIGGTSEEVKGLHEDAGKSGVASRKQIVTAFRKKEQLIKTASASLELELEPETISALSKSKESEVTSTSKMLEIGSSASLESVIGISCTSEKALSAVGESPKQMPVLEVSPGGRSRKKSKKSKKVSETAV